jgi:hypothetical protein
MNELVLASRFERVRTLIAPAEIEHAYRRATCGPSGYALVKFRCEPSSELSFDSAADWPSDLGVRYTGQLEEAVKRGVVEAFVGGRERAARVCKVVLVSIGWHNVQSSEVAFQRATAEALSSLANNDKLWSDDTA